MTDLRHQLIQALRKQEAFASGYSPLYQQILGTLADLVEQEPDDPVAEWLVRLAEVRPPFELTLLVPAALHRGVLAGEPALAQMTQFYPSVGGVVPSADSNELAPVLHGAVLNYARTMEPFVRTATIQTNETARGLAWLLPLMYTHWTAVHLLELGASAGLNLLAEWRSYRLIDDAQLKIPPVDLGRGEPIQFVNHYEGHSVKLPSTDAMPRIASRTGLDIAPFSLKNAADEQLLTAYVWADQTVRIARLREGIAALRAAEAVCEAPQLHAVRLPDQLQAFLEGWSLRSSRLPIVIYNTVMTMYLDDGASGLRDVVERWAREQAVPVLWLQWEPPTDPDEAPQWAWMSWTADLWQNGQHDHFKLAWVHPHATEIQWLPELARWSMVASDLH